MPLILHGLAPIHWTLGGLGIATVVVLLAFLYGRRMGCSSGFDDICSLAVPFPYFRRAGLLANRRWRLPVLIGLLSGGAISAWLGGGWSVTWSVGMLDERLALTHAQKLIWMLVGGLFIGFGTRLGGGCTSGHGIFGLSNLEKGSLLSVLAFFISGIVVTNLLYRVVLP
jgi:uncharacterized protein